LRAVLLGVWEPLVVPLAPLRLVLVPLVPGCVDDDPAWVDDPVLRGVLPVDVPVVLPVLVVPLLPVLDVPLVPVLPDVPAVPVELVPVAPDAVVPELPFRAVLPVLDRCEPVPFPADGVVEPLVPLTPVKGTHGEVIVVGALDEPGCVERVPVLLPVAVPLCPPGVVVVDGVPVAPL